MNIIASLTHHFAAILSVVTAECDDRLRDTDLRGVQLFYLLCICHNPGLSQDRLAQQLGVNGSNVTRRVCELERMGYISRHRNPEDKRQWLVEPTDRTYELLPRLVDTLSDIQRALTRDMSPEEQELLGELAEHMAKNAARCSAERKRKESPLSES